ncbi:Bifunctional protein HldE [Austwickia sp. TVS 96-490-7B]|uniref:adenylyltransferase/cytidyltransferase family protein n=1 Tax=Austwickia sp. TVS 96-490-7B TaxID=2830843 RepID=UPI001DFDCFB5|nr:adenylyltransferase/cytidyltransferase family protein [Austwickia sp. TVS 96-490-7B]MBW3084138.1 Bifunctional protein HldE [Austwickia sp. TVS 96-490-7B]
MVKGYVSGVFDMFHIGHLNIILQARKHCDHLIVGVVSDGVVEKVKSKTPVIPLDERMAIVQHLAAVDQVVVDDHADKFDSWQEFRYDVIFKGDDWQHTPKGDKLEADLRQVGARVEYFPYTRHTSSTLLREVLSNLATTPIQPLPDDDDETYDDQAGPATCEKCGAHLPSQDQTDRSPA